MIINVIDKLKAYFVKLNLLRFHILAISFVFSKVVLAVPPNIVFILADDLNKDVWSHNTRIKKIISDQGVNFKSHFVNVSLCCPSRISTLRGQYAHNTGIFTNTLPNGGFGKVFNQGLESSTIATWLKSSGYETALIGKYLNGYPNLKSGINYIPPGWSYWVSPNGGNPYNGWDYTLNENGKTIYYGTSPTDYMVDVISKKSAEFISSTVRQKPNKPFFLYVAPYAPHAPAWPPARYKNKFLDTKLPFPPSFNELDITDKPSWVRKLPLINADQIRVMERYHMNMLQSMEAVADLVENIVNTLQSNDVLKNTYIFFTSDNGIHQGEHRLLTGKETAYMPDISVPLVVRGPGVPKGKQILNITANVDFAPTWANIAGIKIPSFVDGRSLISFLKGTRPNQWRKAILLEHGGPSTTVFNSNSFSEPQDLIQIQAAEAGIGLAPVFIGLHTGWHAIGNYGSIDYVEYDTGEREFYDLSIDPYELKNSYSKQPLSVIAKLSNRIKLLRNSAGQHFRNIEANPL